VSSRKDYIGPTIKKRKHYVIPEGPVAELNNKTTKGMIAAQQILGPEPPKVEGTRVETPLQLGPPALPPGRLNKREEMVRDPEKNLIKTIDGKILTSEQVMGNTHIGSLQTLLSNDRMEKPRVRAWQDEELPPS
jgi:hypothetical protein